jgi:NCS1 family nucleobase:cation symporter-1
MMVDYYIIKKEELDVEALFDDSPNAKYYYKSRFNYKANLARVLSGYIAVGTIWPNILILGLDDFFSNLGASGYAWIIGTSLGAVVHLGISKR